MEIVFHIEEVANHQFSSPEGQKYQKVSLFNGVNIPEGTVHMFPPGRTSDLEPSWAPQMWQHVQ